MPVALVIPSAKNAAVRSSIRVWSVINLRAAYPMELPFNSLKSGPVHLNIQFSEPLNSDDDGDWLAEVKIKEPIDFNRKTAGTFYTKSNRGVLVIGHDRAGFSVISGQPS